MTVTAFTADCNSRCRRGRRLVVEVCQATTRNSSRNTAPSFGITALAPGSPPQVGPSADIVEDVMDLKPLQWGLPIGIVVWVILVLIVWTAVH